MSPEHLEGGGRRGGRGGRGGCKCCDGCGIGSRHACNPHATSCIDALQVGAVVTLESVTVCVRACVCVWHSTQS